MNTSAQIDKSLLYDLFSTSTSMKFADAFPYFSIAVFYCAKILRIDCIWALSIKLHWSHGLFNLAVDQDRRAKIIISDLPISYYIIYIPEIEVFIFCTLQKGRFIYQFLCTSNRSFQFLYASKKVRFIYQFCVFQIEVFNFCTLQKKKVRFIYQFWVLQVEKIDKMFNRVSQFPKKNNGNSNGHSFGTFYSQQGVSKNQFISLLLKFE